MAFDGARLSEFFGQLPHTTDDAVKLARECDRRVEGRSYVKALADRPIRHALEVRHPTFANDVFVALLRRHRIALCVADTAGHFPNFEDVTADFVYVRLHGEHKLYESGYERASLRRWAKRVAAWQRGSEIEGARRASTQPLKQRAKGRDVYVYFDNDAKVHAPFDAVTLRSLLNGSR